MVCGTGCVQAQPLAHSHSPPFSPRLPPTHPEVEELSGAGGIVDDRALAGRPGLHRPLREQYRSAVGQAQSIGAGGAAGGKERWRGWLSCCRCPVPCMLSAPSLGCVLPPRRCCRLPAHGQDRAARYSAGGVRGNERLVLRHHRTDRPRATERINRRTTPMPQSTTHRPTRNSSCPLVPADTPCLRGARWWARPALPRAWGCCWSWGS